MTLTKIQGDLFDPEFAFDYIAQGTNCFGILGGGIAVEFERRFPLMAAEYKEECKRFKAVLLGTIQVSISDSYANAENPKVNWVPGVINLFTQYYPGPDATLASLEKATFLMLKEVDKEQATAFPLDPALKLRVGLPLIGCGIGGLEPHNVLHVWEQLLSDSIVDFLLVTQPEDEF